MITACSELRKVLFLASSVCGFLSVYEIFLEPLKGFAPNHREDVFGPSLGRVERSRSKVKRQGHLGQKRHFSALSAACVQIETSNLVGRLSVAIASPRMVRHP